MSEIDAAVHRRLAVQAFNACWDHIERLDRTPEDDLAMVHLAHASRYHWEQVRLRGGESGPRQAAIGDWQVSRAWALAGEAGPALRFAGSAWDVCESAGAEVGGVERGFAIEAMARALYLAGRADEALVWILRGRELALALDAGDRGWLELNLDAAEANLAPRLES